MSKLYGIKLIDVFFIFFIGGWIYTLDYANYAYAISYFPQFPKWQGKLQDVMGLLDLYFIEPSTYLVMEIET